MEKYKTQYEHVVGSQSEEEAADVLNYLQECLNETEDEETKQYEIEPTDKDKEIIQAVETAVDNLIIAYGGKPQTISPEKIKLVPPETVYKITNGRIRMGVYGPRNQKFAIERWPSDICFALILAHEFLHAKSYKAIQVMEKDGKRKIDLYRSGIAMYDRKTATTKFFAEIEEAIVAGVEKEFYQQEIKTNHLYRSEVLKIDRIKKWIKVNIIPRIKDEQELAQTELLLDNTAYIPNVDKVITFIEGDVDSDNPIGYKFGFLMSRLESLEKDGAIFFSRRQEKEKFGQLLKEIVDKSNGKFQSTDEVFDEFAKANFSGRLISLGRMIERILGKGAFRKIANDFKYEL